LKIKRSFECTGMCDASAAVPVGTNLFLAASDEDSTLRLYLAGEDGAPLKEFNLNTSLELSGHTVETDLEGAALVGNRAFWISSPGRNYQGKLRLNRERFFATDIHGSGTNLEVVLVGRPCATLVLQLLGDRRYSQFDLARASQLPPKTQGALNIEGLAATPE